MKFSDGKYKPGDAGKEKLNYLCGMLGTKLLTVAQAEHLGVTVANSLKMVALDSERVKKSLRKESRVKHKTSLFHCVNLSSAYTVVIAGSSVPLSQKELAE